MIQDVCLKASKVYLIDSVFEIGNWLGNVTPLMVMNDSSVMLDGP